jgi:AraC family transcriptional regulator
MPELKTHGGQKYPESKLLLTSSGNGWSGVSAELRTHGLCDTPAVVPRQLELSMAITGSTDGYVTRTGAGMRQQTVPSDGTIWISPMAVCDNEINVAVPLPEVLHLFVPAYHFTDLAQEFNLPRSASQSIRYEADAQDEVLRQLGLIILSELREESVAGRMLVETAAVMLAARLAQAHGDCWSFKAEPARHQLGDVRLRQVLDYIAAHIDRDISLAELAAVACLSVYHFSRMFHASVGMSPQRYLRAMYLKRAKEMLAGGKLSLAQIALASHFSSQASFTRAFRREVSMSPGEYRRRCR